MIRKIGMSLIMMAASTGIAYAAWSTFGQVNGNVFAIGTLATLVDGNAIVVNHAIPGGTPAIQSVMLTNTGDQTISVAFKTNPTVNTNSACDYVKLTVSANWSGGSYPETTYTVNQWMNQTTIVGTPKIPLDGNAFVTISGQLDPAAPNEVQGGNCSWDETFFSE